MFQVCSPSFCYCSLLLLPWSYKGILDLKEIIIRFWATTPTEIIGTLSVRFDLPICANYPRNPYSLSCSSLSVLRFHPKKPFSNSPTHLAFLTPANICSPLSYASSPEKPQLWCGSCSHWAKQDSDIYGTHPLWFCRAPYSILLSHTFPIYRQTYFVRV